MVTSQNSSLGGRLCAHMTLLSLEQKPWHGCVSAHGGTIWRMLPLCPLWPWPSHAFCRCLSGSHVQGAGLLTGVQNGLVRVALMPVGVNEVLLKATVVSRLLFSWGRAVGTEATVLSPAVGVPREPSVCPGEGLGFKWG